MSVAEQRVALGPVAGTDWCVLDAPPAGCVAPDGVVLCHEGTLIPHPEAYRAAHSAWEILERWRDIHEATVITVDIPPLAPGRAPAPSLSPQWGQP